MSVVVFAQPYTPPPPPPPRKWVSHSMIWEGSDGSKWNLSDPSSGLVLLNEGLQGLHFPAWDRFTSQSPAAPGARFRGTRVTSREVTWAVHLYSSVDYDTWLRRDRAFWRSFSPDVPGTWAVSAPDGQMRRLRCRLASGGDYTYGALPTAKGWATYPVNLIADDPYWEGEPVSQSWQASEPALLFGGGAPAEAGTASEVAPPLAVSAKSSYASARMSNPGDVAAWPVWTVTGPATDVVLSVGSGSIGVPNLAEGQTVVIDTDPANPVAWRNGSVDVSGSVDPWDPRPIKPGASVAVTVQMSQLARLECTVTPRYYRAI